MCRPSSPSSGVQQLKTPGVLATLSEQLQRASAESTFCGVDIYVRIDYTEVKCRRSSRGGIMCFARRTRMSQHDGLFRCSGPQAAGSRGSSPPDV